MKNIIALLAMSLLLASCGSETTVVNEPIDWNVIVNEANEHMEEETLSDDEINEAIGEIFNDSAE